MVGVDACICELRVDARVEREEGDTGEPVGEPCGHAHCAYLYVRAEYSRDSSLY